ncbi:MAG: hypothetical protein ACRDG4_18385 [Chloroflexota bacterium]
MIRRFAGLVLVVLLIGSAIAVRVSGDPFAHAAGNGNSGDTKISQFPYPDHGNQGNEPHVPCGFYILGFNFAATQGTVTVNSWPPTGDRSVVLTDTFTGTVDDSGNYQFVNGPYFLNPGHYKSYVTDNKGNEIAKQKVFWVDGPCSPPPPPCTGTGCGAVTTFTVSHRSMNLAGIHWSHVAKAKRG